MNLTDTDRAGLKAAREGFTRMMSGLTPDQQLSRATVIAGGIREADPLTRAMAQQIVDAQNLRDNMEAAQKELAEIDATNLNTYRPQDPNFRGRMLSRRKGIEDKLQEDAARLVGLAEDRLESAQRRAVQYFRELRARDERQARIAEAVARKQAEADQAEIDAIAENIVNGGRFRIGKSRSAGHSQ